jgi:hypothetical protein
MDNPPPGPGRSDRGSTIIAGAILAASLVLYWGMSNSAPRYQLAASGSSIVRMDTDSGAVISCDAQRCRQIQPPDRARTLGAIGIEIGRDENGTQTKLPQQ